MQETFSRKSRTRDYLSLFLLFVPPILFFILAYINRGHPRLQITHSFPYISWQFYVMLLFGSIATIGGLLDWQFHRNVLKMKISQKERDAEARALGLGGVPMFILMWFAMLSNKPINFLIPILIVLVYTVVCICYDEFVFHIKRCGKRENFYHKLLVFGNAVAWLGWFHFIYYS